MNRFSQHWTLPSTITLLSSFITHLPTLMTSTSRMPYPQPSPHPYTNIIPTSAPSSDQRHIFDDSEYRYHFGNFFNCINARTNYQFWSQPTNSEKQRKCTFRRIALVANSSRAMLLHGFVVSLKLVPKTGQPFQRIF